MSPRSDSNLGGVQDALEAWETNLRLFEAAGGTVPEGDARRLAFTEILPAYVSVHMTMHMDKYPNFIALKKFTMKYAKVMVGLAATRKRGKYMHFG